MIIRIIVGFVVAAIASSVSASDYKDAADAAYCIGVFQSDIEDWKAASQSQLLSTKLRDLEQKQFRNKAFVEGAMREGIIDADIVVKMKSAGYADAKMCRKTGICAEKAAERADKMDIETNHRITQSCYKQFEPSCERAYKKCE